MSSHHMNRQPEGIPTGGQFAETTHPESGVSISAPIPQPDERIYKPGAHVLWEDEEGREHPGVIKAVDGDSGLTVALDDGTVAETAWYNVRLDEKRETDALIQRVSAGSDTYALAFVQYDDKLRDDQVSRYLSGDYDTVQDEVSELFDESVIAASTEQARDLLKEAGSGSTPMAVLATAGTKRQGSSTRLTARTRTAPGCPPTLRRLQHDRPRSRRRPCRRPVHLHRSRGGTDRPLQ
ncbi:hypothetical protein [Arthrobacter sp. IK3]|uniref:hypothetical protein n=1 Tax=Arthrobacter sp. IK3 TaxID=3448169 RepID=UPI003EDFA763